LLDRIQQRNITGAQLTWFLQWLDTQPEMPDKSWFKKFPGMTVCGEGELVKTFLTPAQVPVGEEIH
jgi:hypothetical protein